MIQPIKLPERSRVSLLKLFQQQQQAEAMYKIAAGHTLAALGLDPDADVEIDLDAGVIRPRPAAKTPVGTTPS